MKDFYIPLGKKGFRGKNGWNNGYVKPTGKFWKRFFNKKVRRGEAYKYGNWWKWC